MCIQAKCPALRRVFYSWSLSLFAPVQAIKKRMVLSSIFIFVPWACSTISKRVQQNYNKSETTQKKTAGPILRPHSLFHDLIILVSKGILSPAMIPQHALYECNVPLSLSISVRQDQPYRFSDSLCRSCSNRRRSCSFLRRSPTFRPSCHGSYWKWPAR